MNSLNLELPMVLRTAISGEATRRGVTESAWIEEAVREKLKFDAELTMIQERAALADRQRYDQLLDRVPDAPPEPGDELPS